MNTGDAKARHHCEPSKICDILPRLLGVIATLALSAIGAFASTAPEPERGPDYKAPPDTVFIEAESMQTDRAGWQVKDYSVDDGYYGYPSGLKLLGGKPGATGVATSRVLVPQSGRYRLWIRCLNYQSAPYRVTVTQNSREMAHAEFNEGTPAEPEDSDKTYKTRAFVWWYVDVDLIKGPCDLALIGMKASASSPGPWIDCMAMTTDLSFQPHIWSFAPPLYLRLVMGPTHNKAGGVAFFSGRIDFEGYFCGRGHITKQGYGQTATVFGDDAKYFLHAGDKSPWVNIGPSLDPRGMNRMRFTMMSHWPDPMSDSDFTVELARSPGEKPFYRAHRYGKGAGMILLVDRRHLENTKSNTDWSATRLREALAVPAPANGKPPTLFPSFTGLSDFDTLDPEPAIRNDLLTLRALGFTGSTASYHDAEWMKAHGMIYTYLQSFIFSSVKEPDCLDDPDADSMRNSFASAVKNFYTEIPQPLFLRVMDEIHSMDVSQMKACPGCEAKFRDFLRRKGLQPAKLLGHALPAGSDPWESIELTEDRKASPELFYYTQIFREQILTDFVKVATGVLQIIKPGLRTASNTSIELTYYKNGLDLGADIFSLYKSNALTYGYAEDANSAWPSGQTASFMMDSLRSACKYNHQPYATFTMSSVPPRDGETKAFDEIGHGASFVHFYDYGPYHSDASDPLSQYAPQYFPAWKEFNYALGSAENDLYGAQVLPSRVALLYSQTTDIWTSPFENPSGSGMERIYLYLLLRHLGYPVDILTEDDVLEGRADGYGAVFTVESHFKDGVVDKLLEWTKKGGFLYAGAGAGRFGKYNELVPGFEAAGLKRGLFAYNGQDGAWPQDLAVVDKVQFGGTTLEAAAGKQPVASDSAGQVVLRFADGTPCATQITYGQGHILYLGFFPGISYVREANIREVERRAAVVQARAVPETYFASWYPEGYRQMMQTLLKPMGIDPSVRIDNYLVEGNLLQGKNGEILGLANWSAKKQTIHVTVDLPYPPDVPRSAINSLRDIKRQGRSVSFTMDLGSGNFVVLPQAK